MSIMKYINIFVVLVQNQILVYCNNHRASDEESAGQRKSSRIRHEKLGTDFALTLDLII